MAGARLHSDGRVIFRRAVGPEVEIRQFHVDDAELVFAATERNRAYLREWLPWVDRTESPADIRQFIVHALAQFEANQGPNCAIWVNGELAGSIGCHAIDWNNSNCSIGYWIDAAYQGRGIITRCCEVLIDHLFFDLQLHRVVIQCGTGNHKSCAIPKRLGFTREGVLREAEWVSGRWVDLVVWSMLVHDWRARASGSRQQ